MRSQNILLASEQSSTAAQPAVSNSRLLNLKIALALPRLDAAARAFWSTVDLQARMPAFFQELYAIVRGGLQVMQVASDRADSLAAERDPVAQLLAPYLRRHVEEEREHETWLLVDISACGFDSNAVRNRVVQGPVAALLGAQTFWAMQEHPVSFLGYLSVVEANPPTRSHLDVIREITGLPAEAFRCMREHADADIGHAEELHQLIDSLPVTARLHELMALSAFETIEALARIFDGLCHQQPRNEAL